MTVLDRLRLGVDPYGDGQAQYRQGDQELEDLDDELGGLVLVVVRLLGRRVLDLGGYRRRVDLTDVVLVHHCPGSRAVPHVLEVVGRVLGCKCKSEFVS